MVKLNEHFKKCEIQEAKQAKWFSSEFGVKLEKLPQRGGCVGDYKVIANSESCVELFNDLTIVEFN